DGKDLALAVPRAGGNDAGPDDAGIAEGQGPLDVQDPLLDDSAAEVGVACSGGQGLAGTQRRIEGRLNIGSQGRQVGAIGNWSGCGAVEREREGAPGHGAAKGDRLHGVSASVASGRGGD